MTDAVDDLKSAFDASDAEINELHNLVDYQYHTPFYRAPNASENSSLKLGIQRDGVIVILNGTLNYTSQNTATRVRLNGGITTTNSSNGTKGWTTNTLSLIPGHFYRASLRLLSGSATTTPAIGFLYSGGTDLVSTGSRATTNTYIAEFTAEENKTYNIALYCAKDATFTDAKVIVTLQDVTAADNALKQTNAYTGLDARLSSAENTLESGMSKKWTTAELTQGYWASRAIVTSDKAVCTAQLYPVEVGDTIRFSNNADGLYFAYQVYLPVSGASDASGWITGVEHEHTFTASGNLFVQFANARVAEDRTAITPADITLDFGILDKGYVINSIAALNRNVGKIINTGTRTLAFLGDSITAGVGTNYAYHMYLHDRFGWACKNYGYGGSGYARSYPSTGGKMATGQEGLGVTITNGNKFEPNDFLTRIATIPTTVDALVIFGGTNDWAHGDVISVSDFITAVNNVFTYAQSYFGRIPIIVLLPIHRGNDTTPNATTGKTLKDYCDIIKEIAVPYGIRCIDLFAESGLNPANQHNNDLYYVRDDTSVSDSVHPNHYAHKMISNIIASTLYDALY